MDASADRTRLIVGLGNPGRRYERTRHNVGFRVIDALASRWACPASRAAFGGQLAEAFAQRGDDRTKVRLFKPETFMNASGRAVVDVVRFYRLEIEDVLVIYDDLALPTGKLRARAQGSAGGHKGLADIIRALHSDTVPRLRIGIDQAPDVMATEDYVLGKFTEAEEADIAKAIRRTEEAVECWLFEGLQRVMELYNAGEAPTGQATETE
jgi:PTH1 family peptidyl-tRNA hydrolase